VFGFRRFLALALAAGCGLSAFTQSAVAAGETSVPLPFDQGETVQIVQGYNGGTHQGASIYGLDLVLADGDTSGAPVLAPFDGTVPWAFAPGEKTGCIEILATDRQYGAMLCHVILDRPFGHGEKVARGQQLGSVGAPGMVGNNGLAHVHMELHVAGHSDQIVPFSASEGGLPLEGWDLPASGASNEHAGDGPIVSSTAPLLTADVTSAW
jgi:murein DD-endopeptidase MepM/ murein hydrolase activator NlpD